MVTTSSRPSDYVLTLSCPDRPGLVHAVSGFLVEHGGNIVESRQYTDREVGTFFMRVHFEMPVRTRMPVETQMPVRTRMPAQGGMPARPEPPGRDVTSVRAETQPEPSAELAELRRDFDRVSGPLHMTWRLQAAAERQRVLVMASRLGHCLNDLLFRRSVGGLRIDVPAVVSNHPDLARLAEHYGVPFHHLPVEGGSKPAAEARLLTLVDELDVDLVVLARYMQVLSPSVCEQLDGRVINIHHSMLPSFAGARPYHQAHARGVKLVGATAHYVTAELDDGPIIEQEVTRVDHSMSADDVMALGRDLECQALARAVRWHTENRILRNGRRTVVLQ